jgi:DNA-binding NarL/FixJ family response regulator
MHHLLIVDDHPLYRMALRQTLAAALPGSRIDEAGDLGAAHAALDAAPDTDLVLLDLQLPGTHGLLALGELRAAHPGVAVAILSGQDDAATVRRALAMGACGYITKHAGSDELHGGVQALLAGETWMPAALRELLARTPRDGASETLAARLASLSPQQLKVLQRVAEGRLNKQIADELGIQERTVKAHLTVVFEKLGVRNRTQAGVLLSGLAGD